MPDGSALDQWDFPLPDSQIALHPSEDRTSARLMVLEDGAPRRDAHIRDLPELLRPTDLLVANDTRVMAARLRATRASGGAVEILVLEPGPGPVQAMVRPLRRLRIGEVLQVDGGGTATIEARLADGVGAAASFYRPYGVAYRPLAKIICGLK